MKSKKRKPNGYWTLKHCLDEALKCVSRTEFHEKYPAAYAAAHRKGWLSSCTRHMEILGNKYNRLIYAIFFSDNHVYVGLTGNPKRRFKDHLNDKKGIPYKYIEKTGLKPEFKILTKFLDRCVASKKEGVFKEKFQKEGYVILNKSKTGGLGGVTKMWTKEKCLKEALKYKTRTEFQKNNTSSYQSARKNKWLKEICSHMEIKNKPITYWTFNNIMSLAKKYKSLFEFKKRHGKAFSILSSNIKWKKIIYKKLNWIHRKPNGYWTKEVCKLHALKYKSKEEWKKKFNSVYVRVCKNGWLEECCSHMTLYK